MSRTSIIAVAALMAATAVSAQTPSEELSKRIADAETRLYAESATGADEAAFANLLREALSLRELDSTMRQRYELLLESAERNRPSTIAANFDALTADGTDSATSLHTLAAQADTTAVVFYDPDCDHCREVMSALASWPHPGRQVVAVYFDGDPSMLPTVREVVPQGWVSIYTPDNPIDAQGLYTLRHVPTIYLLDRESRVIAKDIAPSSL